MRQGRRDSGERITVPPMVPALPLAQGELDAEDAAELQALKQQIRGFSGFICEGYKEKCLRRRIAVRMRARGVHTYGDYGALLADDAAEYALLLSAVTINVSKFFRNAEVWQVLADRVIPGLFEAQVPIVRIWSAGAASGEEAHSLAILLLEHAERIGDMKALRRFRILGTDIDREVLDAARRGEYPDLALAETTPERVERWFEKGGPPHRLRQEVKDLVRFEQIDLLTTPPERMQNLILCRNVIIYFERVVQERLFTTFADALAPGGFLLLGKVETMLGPSGPKFRIVANAERLYLRV